MSYIAEIITAFDKAYPKGKGTKSSAKPKNLFVINEDSKKLDQDKVVESQNIVAKNLYATRRERPDTCTAITFLTTRVRSPAEDDCAKLVHLMQCLRGTINISPTLSANRSVILKWWVDTSYRGGYGLKVMEEGVLGRGYGGGRIGYRGWMREDW